MSPPDRAASACEAMQTELQALLIDRERPSEPATELWAHLATCDRCAQALAQDRALHRALGRLRGGDRAPMLLRERLRRLLCPKPGGSKRGPGGGSRSG